LSGCLLRDIGISQEHVPVLQSASMTVQYSSKSASFHSATNGVILSPGLVTQQASAALRLSHDVTSHFRSVYFEMVAPAPKYRNKLLFNAPCCCSMNRSKPCCTISNFPAKRELDRSERRCWLLPDQNRSRRAFPQSTAPLQNKLFGLCLTSQELAERQPFTCRY
jgi:hypothetical protein